MTHWSQGLTRRRFLSGLAVAGVTPIAAKVAEAFPESGPPKQWTGDNFDEAHELMRNPYATLRSNKDWESHPELYEVIVVGGGISGLAVAYTLRHRNLLLLERERQTGGVSKSENWNGIEYSLGAAYMIDPEPGEGDPPNPNFELLKELGLRVEGENLDRDHNPSRRWSHGKDNHCLFTNTEAFSEEEVYSRQNIEFFEQVAEGPYPDIPPKSDDLVKALDSISYKEFLYDARLQQEIWKKTLGPLSPRAREATEYYFWGAFGTNTWETSAYHGLNFFAAEFGNILVFPGGNAFIAKRLTERIRQHNPQLIRTGHYVLVIEPNKEKKSWTVLAYHQNRIHRYQARAVVFASPLFLAKRMIPNLPDAQRKAIDSLDYRSFVVANILLKRRLDQIFKKSKKIQEGYELTRLHDVDVQRQLPDVLNGQKVFSDVCTADFASWRSNPYAVLTVYRPFPYAHGRDRLRYLTYEYVEAEIRKAVLEGFSHHGLENTHIEDIRLTRWGHPMIIPRPGQMLPGGPLEIGRQSQPGLYFAHTDTQGAPAIENALASARAAVKAVTKEFG